MDLNNKLKGLPPIYYVNLDYRNDRREYMEKQFEKWNITNYTRVSASRLDPAPSTVKSLVKTSAAV